MKDSQYNYMMTLLFLLLAHQAINAVFLLVFLALALNRFIVAVISTIKENYD